MCKTFHDYVKVNALKPHEKYDDKNSLPKSMEDKDDGCDENSDAVYEKMPMLVSDHDSDTDKDEVEDPKLVQEENKSSEQTTHNLTSQDS